MKFFAVLAVCLAVANARPDVSGYAYPKPPAGFNNENYIAQPPAYTGDSSNTQFLTVPGKTTTFTTVTRGGGFDGGNSFTSGGGGSGFTSGGGSGFSSGGGITGLSSGGGGSGFTSGGGGGSTFTTGVIGGSGPAFETTKTVTTTRTDGGFGSVGGLDGAVTRFSSGSQGGALGGGSVTTNEYNTLSGGSQGFGVGSSIGGGGLGGGQSVTTKEYTTVTGGGTGVRGSFGTGSLGGGPVTTNEYTTVQGGLQGFGGSGSSFTSGSGGLDGRFGQQTITNLGGNYAQEKTRYVNVQTRYVTKAPIITKNFYVHGAPEDDEEIVSRQTIHVPAPQKHYKIIFIKAPQPVGYNAAAIPPPVQNEEKTIVYVLVKKPEGTDQEIEIPAPPPTKPSKPEVYFIKYKGKDATQTIQTIQNQYAGQGVQTGYSGGGITSGIVPGGSNTFTNTKTVGRFGGNDGAVQLSGVGGNTGSTTFTTKTVTSGGDSGVQFVAPTGGSFTTNTVTGGGDGGVQYVSTAPAIGSTYTTKTVTTGGGAGGSGSGQFIASAPGGLTSYTTKTVSGGDGGAQFIASVPTGGSTYTTKTVTSGGNTGFGSDLRFAAEDGAAGGNLGGSTYTVNTGPVSGSTYTTKTITSEQVGDNTGFSVLRFGGTDGLESGSSGTTTFTASAPTTTYTSKTVQVPSSTYEYISGSTSGTLGQNEDCCGGSHAL